MLYFNCLSKILAATLFLAASCSAGVPPALKANRYIVTFEPDELSEQWGQYFFNHLSKRSQDKSSVVLWEGGGNKEIPDGDKVIHFEIAGNLVNDYCIKHTTGKLHVYIRDIQAVRWIIYQLISRLALEDKRITAADLPPAIIDFNSRSEDFDFVYREPYFSLNLQPDYAPVAGTNNIETDWAIWGHNLSKLIEEIPNENIYASVNGIRDKRQFSFSSPELFDQICNSITNNYGENFNEPYRFMIMPEDNDLVCDCSSCIKLGNTQSDATPAVTYLVNKLADRFPQHRFFTTAYRTTSTPPEHRLAENAGVFISTINLPKGIEPDREAAETQKFLKEIEAWKSKTAHIYLWDYAANFDDYLTPIPVLYGLKKQLVFFREQGIEGIFLHANGYDYAPFDDVKSFVSGALMMDTEMDIDSLCRQYFRKEYPESNELLSDYYLSLEKKFASSRKTYDMYGSMRKNMDSYFDPEQFIRFYNALEAIIRKTRDTEKDKLQKLFTALSYTRLQTIYVNGLGREGFINKEGNKITVRPELNTFLESLEKSAKYPDMKYYKEADGSLMEYIDEWTQLLSRGDYINELQNTPVEILSGSDEGFERSALLHDGVLGFATDYHQGWHLSSKNDLHIRFSTKDIQDSNTVRVRFLNNEKHGIYPPEKAIVYVDGKQAEEISLPPVNDFDKAVECTIRVNLSDTENIEIKFIRKQAKKSILACDEVIVLKLK